MTTGTAHQLPIPNGREEPDTGAENSKSFHVMKILRNQYLYWKSGYMVVFLFDCASKTQEVHPDDQTRPFAIS